MNDSDLIDQLGGTNAVAGLTQNTAATVSGWRVRGISWRFRAVLAALAAERGINNVPADFLLVQRPKAPRMGDSYD